jgi:hypothetical protein
MFEPLSSPIESLSQVQVVELVDLAEQAIASPHATALGQDNAVWIPTVTKDLEDSLTLGTLVFERLPKSDPEAFLGIRYLENSYGPNRIETERLFSFSEDVEGLIFMKASDVLDTSSTTDLLLESAELDQELSEHSDREMVEAAAKDMQNEIADRFTLEVKELELSLKQATGKEYNFLKQVLQGAITPYKPKYEESDDERGEDGQRRGRIATFLQKILHRTSRI